jgi:dTDP-4-amino-4,6-dideoxygalactose transaminase
VASFEAAAAEHFLSPHAVAVSSGTAALQLIFAGLEIGPGDEVVVPSVTFAATAAAAFHAGARPVFADLRGLAEPWLSVEAAEAVITEETRAIVTVSYAGYPGEVDALRALCDQRGLFLIEDAAHGVGARAQSRGLGTIGHAGGLSFFSNKNLPLGEGGMILTGSAELAERFRLLRSHGLTSGTWERHRTEVGSYQVIEPGFNFRMDEPRAALGSLLLARIEPDNRRRRRLSDRYTRAVSELPRVRPALPSQLVPGTEPSCHIYPVILEEGVSRPAVRAAMSAAGVQTAVHYPALHLSPAFAGPRHLSLPVSESYARRTLTLPLFPHMTEAQQDLVCSSLQAAVTAGSGSG